LILTCRFIELNGELERVKCEILDSIKVNIDFMRDVDARFGGKVQEFGRNLVAPSSRYRAVLHLTEF